ncbi:MAG: hypothetical protein KF810_03535 [Rhizobiaceae bacterium]|nr:hypothetical protein [Rhizobiaceae bacterium]
MVGREGDTDLPATRWELVDRLVSEMVRLRGPLRISVRQTTDGLGIHIPPSRQVAPILFIIFWLCGWAVGEYFAIGELASSGFGFPGIFILVWLIPWTLAGAGCVWVILWQLFGTENLYFTAGALVREWRLLFQGRRRVVMASEIMSVKVDGPGGDVAGLGTIKVETTGKSMRIGSGLDHNEAEFVASLIRGQAEAEHERSGT